MHVVVLPDHVPSDSHDQTLDPCCLYPRLQDRDAWEPNDQPHEREVMAPLIGSWRGGQDVSVDKKILRGRYLRKSSVSLSPVSLMSLYNNTSN